MAKVTVHDNGDGTVTINRDGAIAETITREAWREYERDLIADGHDVQSPSGNDPGHIDRNDE